MEQYVTQFVEAVRKRYPSKAAARIEMGRMEFQRMTCSEKLTVCMLARCPLRICIGLTRDAQMFSRVFGRSTLEHPAALYCLDDLLTRYEPAHALLPPLSFLPGTVPDIICVMKWIHQVQYCAEEMQDVAFELLPSRGS